MIKRLTCLLTLLFTLNAKAALIQYEVELGPNPIDADGGIAMFFWDTSSQLISDLTWDFGPGMTGGVDNSFDWSAPFSGGSTSTFLFEVLTLIDVNSSTCTELGTNCAIGFFDLSPSPFILEMRFFVNADNSQGYGIRVNNALVLGTVLDVRAVNVSAPPIFSILVVGLATLYGCRRFKQQLTKERSCLNA